MSNNPLPSSFDGNEYDSLTVTRYDSELANSYVSEFYEENRWQKFSRRLKEEPLIPFGIQAF